MTGPSNPNNTVGSHLKLIENWNSNSFFEKFRFVSYPDPTHGTVQYVPKEEAFRSGLAYVQDNTVYLRADNKMTTSTGRKSVRLESNKLFNGGLFAFDVKHAPHGCGNWAAMWLYGDPWPNKGNICFTR